jgi:hypothetical protein
VQRPRRVTGWFPHSLVVFEYPDKTVWLGFLPSVPKAPVAAGKLDDADRSKLVGTYVRFEVDATKLAEVEKAVRKEFAEKMYVVGKCDCVSLSVAFAKGLGLEVPPAPNLLPGNLVTNLAKLNGKLKTTTGDGKTLPWPEILSLPAIKAFGETFPALGRIITTPGVHYSKKCRALFGVASYPPERAMPVLLAALSDEMLVGTVRFPKPDGTVDVCACRVQDVACVFILHITKQDIGSYGYECPEIYGSGRFADLNFVCHGCHAIRDPDKRAAAMVRFGWWLLKRELK